MSGYDPPLAECRPIDGQASALKDPMAAPHPAPVPFGSGANLRLTFWGVQGSCPIFPTQEELRDYATRIAAEATRRTLLQIAAQQEQRGVAPPDLRELASPARLGDYQRSLGLPDLPVYGGDTTCVAMETRDGAAILFDMGTGMRDFSRQAVAGDRSRRVLHIFLSHEHLDHRNGLSFASLCFVNDPPYALQIYGTPQALKALDDRYGVFSHHLSPATHVDDPLDYRIISASFSGVEIRTASSPTYPALRFPTAAVDRPIHIGQTAITPFEVYHGNAQCLAYQVRHGESTFVFCTDHELRHGDDARDPRQLRSLEAEERLRTYCHNADLAYFDGQYQLAEYQGSRGIGSSPAIARTDWGHSCIEDVVARVEACNIRRALIGHHDPERPWGERLELDNQLRERSHGRDFKIELARAGMVIEV